MTQNKHTPGPWVWDEDFDALRPLWEMGMAQGYGYIDWHDRTKMDANAHLIAAAPDLLAALETFRDYVADTASGHLQYKNRAPLQAMAQEDLARIDALIAKAEGRE